ncbi:endonuclease domain-containing 1 protein-like [Salvelinus fontinalis]|uniref:endonuclease domain-containing 1 protein-like n=1 Tax=Salvelinus fontinalis TaxID=8038 RepID=UPI002486CA43|nr:endonuclease domain-containing 1 protein-like [Salvelinus fontinalis]XP_055769419.1 endonuclease domain-containing 1 protein-like [Salvelinus fontinalis]XP_055769420.1 endonuclease domain-containing 1 protein-like [Salvelinus fontinalis]XP_055769421.1 endonuclease domain-containing 1 protein-like [Salvelinus fontinalis]XP_055769422.1 endonuclease domain-containing 1 protein-like [Salvelinus fontinalis]XP_055771162.1 endonuclease domain-containing 1 protein-like [Salvelinus fontinalis]XP_05
MQGITPNLPGILVNGTVQNLGQNENRYKPICQLFNNTYRFATLYDTTNRIPVFSAYTFTGNTTGRPDDPWMIEPQLNGEKNSPEMQKMKKVPYKNQADNNDYGHGQDEIDYKGVNRGHLFPSSHAHDLDTQKSTFTLTNIVPQVVSINNGSWREMEENVREKLMTDCFRDNRKIKAYVVTGAVPSKKNKLNNRVNIPKFLWTAYCCLDKNKIDNKTNKKKDEWKKKSEWMAKAHWGWNNKVQKKTLDQLTLGALEEKLNEHHTGPVKVFPKDCPRY